MSGAGVIPDLTGGAHALRPLALSLALALVLGGCGQNDTDPGPGGVTVGEARALDEAAEMLEEQRRAPTAPASPAASATPTS